MKPAYKILKFFNPVKEN